MRETLAAQGFEFHDLALAGGRVQPYFVIDQDLIAGFGKLPHVVEFIRRSFPRFLKIRTLMAGCAAGEGHLDTEDAQSASVIACELAQSLRHVARECRASLIVMKEFPSQYRHALEPLRTTGFTRVPSMPMTRLDIRYASFDDLVARRLSKATRKDIRRKLRAARAAAPIELQLATDITPYVDELYPLYLAVYERSSLRFEKLTREFLAGLGRRMPDKARFFIWRQNAKAIAFSICLVHGDTIYDEYLGLDYSVALDLHLYHYTLRDIINWAIASGLQWYMSSALNYEPKLHLRCELVPLDLYVAHVNPIINAVLKHLLVLMEPTRHDPILKRFANYSEVWG